MTRPLLVANAPPVVHPSYYVVTPEKVVPVEGYPIGRSAGLDCLITQEIGGRRDERNPQRLAELMQTFGFEWEPLSEPGHMRFVGHAAFMLRQAKDNSAQVAESVLRQLDIASVRMDGVSLVDPSPPVMREYLRMTSGDAGLYGDSPYAVGHAGGSYLLRHTSCFQKFSACLDRSLVTGRLPAALFEISDSFRGEPEDVLQLSYRLRRFHLPEAHIHTGQVRDAVDLSLDLHARTLLALSELEAELVLLISASHEFASVHRDYLTRLVANTKSPALLKVSPPGHMCEDGVEVDVEYKIIDALGCCRELSTFQIDDRITRSFGVRCDDGTTPVTIHSVFTGGVERYIYFTLDRIVRAEATGVRSHLPLWMSPVVVRVVADEPAAAGSALSLADQLDAAGIRTELDDRGHGIEAAITDADSLLVPYLVLVSTDVPGGNRIARVRDFSSGVFRDRDTHELIAEIGAASSRPGIGGFQRLSRQPFAPLHAS